MLVDDEEFREFLRLLERRPEWKAELRRLVLTEELLRLPEIVRELVEAHRKAEERLSRLEEAVAELVEAHRKAEKRLSRLEERVGRLEGRAGEMWGGLLEIRYERHAPSYFAELVRRLHVLSKEELQSMLEPALESALLSPEEYRDLIRADLVVRGCRWKEDKEVHLVIEVSAGIGIEDVERAATRAGLLSKLGVATLPVVAGEGIIPEARQRAKELKVFQILDGRLIPWE